MARGASVLALVGGAASACGVGHTGNAVATTASSSVPVTTTTADDGGGAGGSPTIAGTVVPAGAGAAGGPAACRGGPPLANVYHPDRLTVVKTCLTVSGTVETVRSESDGDTHFDLAVDPQFAGLLRPANSSAQHGWLVAEIVPADKPGCAPGQPPRPASGSYDYGVCTGADEATPVVGRHVYVTGPYVLDEGHGGWAEIHPVWAVSSQPPAAAPAPATTMAPAAAAPPGAAAPAPGAGVRIVAVSSPVRRGSMASLTAQTSPNAGCDLEVTLPSGAPSRSQGLGAGTADPAGHVAWSWQTGTRTTPGTATATVTCGSSSASAPFQITS